MTIVLTTSPMKLKIASILNPFGSLPPDLSA